MTSLKLVHNSSKNQVQPSGGRPYGSPGAKRTFLPSGSYALDCAAGFAGYSIGQVAEFIGDTRDGSNAVMSAALRSAAANGRPVALLDRAKSFDRSSLLPLEHGSREVVLFQPDSTSELIANLTECIQSGEFAAVGVAESAYQAQNQRGSSWTSPSYDHLREAIVASRHDLSRQSMSLFVQRSHSYRQTDLYVEDLFERRYEDLVAQRLLLQPVAGIQAKRIPGMGTAILCRFIKNDLSGTLGECTIFLNGASRIDAELDVLEAAAILWNRHRVDIEAFAALAPHQDCGFHSRSDQSQSGDALEHHVQCAIAILGVRGVQEENDLTEAAGGFSRIIRRISPSRLVHPKHSLATSA
jgi:hypothetical protein